VSRFITGRYLGLAVGFGLLLSPTTAWSACTIADPFRVKQKDGFTVNFDHKKKIAKTKNTDKPTLASYGLRRRPSFGIPCTGSTASPGCTHSIFCKTVLAEGSWSLPAGM